MPVIDHKINWFGWYSCYIGLKIPNIQLAISHVNNWNNTFIIFYMALIYMIRMCTVTLYWHICYMYPIKCIPLNCYLLNLVKFPRSFMTVKAFRTLSQYFFYIWRWISCFLFKVFKHYILLLVNTECCLEANWMKWPLKPTKRCDYRPLTLVRMTDKCFLKLFFLITRF